MTVQSKIEAPPNVYQRLNTARTQFHGLKLAKTGKFPKGRGGYFELGDFIVPALSTFAQAGLSGVVSFGDGEARLDVVNVDDPSQVIRFCSPMGSASLQGCHEVQNIGAVQTYQRRYLWMMALEIVEHDALDGSLGDAPQQDHTPARVADDVLTQIIQLCEAVGGNQPGIICKAYEIEALPDLTPSQANAVVNRLKEKLSEKAKAETNTEAAHV